MAYIVTAYIGTAYIVTAYTVTAYIVMAYIAMAHIVMAYTMRESKTIRSQRAAMWRAHVREGAKSKVSRRSSYGPI